MARSFGWKPDKAAPALKWRGKLGGVPIVPARPSALSFLDKAIVQDQETTQSCVGQAVAQALYLSLRLSGLDDAPYPSVLWLYRRARELDVAEKRDVGLNDGGTWLSSATRVIRDVGWPASRYWPWNAAMVNAGIPDQVVLHAHDQRHSVEALGLWTPSRPEVESAICSGWPIAFGSQVTTDVCECASWDPVDYSGPVEGGHAMLIGGYDIDGFHVCNSWGRNWGLNGFCRVSWSALDHVKDAIAIRHCRRATS